MHLVRGLSSTRTTKRKKQKFRTAQGAAESRLARENWDRLMKSHGPKEPVRKGFKPLKTKLYPASLREGSMDFMDQKSLDVVVTGALVSKSMTDPMNLRKESPEVQAAILDKAKRIAPAYNKGAYQYIDGGTDLSDLGRKK